MHILSAVRCSLVIPSLALFSFLSAPLSLSCPFNTIQESILEDFQFTQRQIQHVTMTNWEKILKTWLNCVASRHKFELHFIAADAIGISIRMEKILFVLDGLAEGAIKFNSENGFEAISSENVNLKKKTNHLITWFAERFQWIIHKKPSFMCMI